MTHLLARTPTIRPSRAEGCATATVTAARSSVQLGRRTARQHTGTERRTAQEPALTCVRSERSERERERDSRTESVGFLCGRSRANGICSLLRSRNFLDGSRFSQRRLAPLSADGYVSVVPIEEGERRALMILAKAALAEELNRLVSPVTS